MLKLIPAVKQLEIRDGFLEDKKICFSGEISDSRITAALEKLPICQTGTCVDISYGDGNGEAYELWVEQKSIRIFADGPAGAFYAIQTLRQLLKHDRVPCLYIKDAPDFPHRGFYHDVTRGKVPTLNSVKDLIDLMAS